MPGQGKAIPYGIYDVGRNEGFVSVGITADTAEFAAETIRLWWRKLGRRRYPQTKDLLITADCGGSNSYRCRVTDAQMAALKIKRDSFHGEWSYVFLPRR